MFGFFKKILGFFKEKSTGVAILEAAMTLPIILYVVFFSIELIRIGLAQSAVDAITKECAFSLMAKGNYNDFDSIFMKYKPWGIPIGNFRFYCRLYSNIDTMMANEPYGGETICWYGTDYANPGPNKKPVATNPAAGTGSGGSNPTDAAVFSKYQTRWCPGVFSEVGYIKREKLLNGTEPSSGYIFVLTIAVKFPFSSPFVAKLFNGGSNTDKPGVYILWARGSGIINYGIVSASTEESNEEPVLIDVPNEQPEDPPLIVLPEDSPSIETIVPEDDDPVELPPGCHLNADGSVTCIIDIPDDNPLPH